MNLKNNYKFRSLLSTSVLFVSFVQSSALAQDVEDVIVTGHAISFNAANTEILDIDFIANRTDGNFIDLFRGLSGIDVSQVGGDGGMTQLSVRGGDPNFTTILIDGVKINNPTNSRGGGFDFSSLDPAMIESVEIVRGPASPVMGSGAVSGVINLKTRKGRQKKHLSVSTRYGTDNSFNLSSSYSGRLGSKGDVSFGAAYSEGGDTIEGNNLKRLNLHFNTNVDITESLKIKMALFYIDSDAENFPEDSGGPRLAVLRDLQTRDSKLLSNNITIEYKINEKLEINALYNATRIDETIFSPAIAPGVFNGVPSFTSISNFDRDEIIIHGLYNLSDIVTINVGGAYLKENGGDDGFVDFGFNIPTNFSLVRNTKSLFAELRLSQFYGCGFSVSGRLDDADMFDSEFNVKAGLDCKVMDDGPTLIMSWGEGYKLPSFFALGNPLVGNSQLRPERSSNFEVGLQQTFAADRIQMDLRYYKNRFTDLIDFDPEIFQNVNRDRVNVEGVELSSSLNVHEKIDLMMSVSYTDTNVVGSDVQLRHRPKWKGSFGANINPNVDLALNLFANIQGKYAESSIVTGNLEMNGYTSVDFSAIQKIGNSLAVKLSVRNILNNDYEEIIGFPTLRRVGHLAVNYSF